MDPLAVVVGVDAVGAEVVVVVTEDEAEQVEGVSDPDVTDPPVLLGVSVLPPAGGVVSAAGFSGDDDDAPIAGGLE